MSPRASAEGFLFRTAMLRNRFSRNAVAAFSSVLTAIPEDILIILEPLIDEGKSHVRTEIERAQEVFNAVASPG